MRKHVLLYGLLCGALVAVLSRLLPAVLRNGQAHQLPMRARRQDGSTVSGLTSARPVHINGQEGFVFVFHDMTEAERISK